METSPNQASSLWRDIFSCQQNSAAHKRHHGPKEGACLSGVFPLSTAKIALNITKPTKPQLAELGKYQVGVNTTLNSNGSFFHSHIMMFFPGFKPNKEKIIMKQFHVGKKLHPCQFFSRSRLTHPGNGFQKISRVPCRNQLLALGQSIWQPGWRFSRFSTGSQRFFSVTIDGTKYFKPHNCWWRSNLLSRVLMGNYGTTFPQCFGCELVNLCRLWKPMACVGLSM